MKKVLLSFFLTLFIQFLNSQNDPNLKAYSNFDFISGEKILFEDNFRDANQGEFPGRWKLINNQGVVNQDEAGPYFIFQESTMGSMGKVEPRMKVSSYLKSSFTVEFDYFLPEEESIHLNFKEVEDDGKFIDILAIGEVKTGYFSSDLVGKFAGNNTGTWHHAAFAYKDHQIKCFIDHERVLVVPNCEFTPIAVSVSGSQNVRFKNFVLAEGGGMNMLDKILTDGKFISHAIRFDVAKYSIKGESIGFIKELAAWMKKNPTVSLEIAGHTDADGDDASNMELSKKRAEAVRDALVSMGIETKRLKPMGYGETKPMNSNTTPEGKAENRRVEFVKL